ncbi:hypothetical protein S40293_08278 [Stachybotrys chartarum IBT 40293]|nr:hypothetical protein S40293_08278 [Stachybotrys chartarum IBT 40293]
MAADDDVVPFSRAIAVKQLDSHTYGVHLHACFCIGAGTTPISCPQKPFYPVLTPLQVPNGGYTASCMLAAARTHLSSRGQPDTLTAHFEYPTRLAVGPAVVTVDEVKLGRQLSTLHLTLWQGGLLPAAPWLTPAVSRRAIVAYATQTDLAGFTGVTLQTGYQVSPAAAPAAVPDFAALKESGGDGVWREPVLPKSSGFARSLRNWRFYMRSDGQQTSGAVDAWIRMASGERIRQPALAYVIDSFPYNIFTLVASPEARQQLQTPRGPGQETEAEETRSKLWFPTVAMNLEVKKALPADGVEWLAVRISSKQIRDGRFDLEVVVRDAQGEMVALGYQTAMILSLERNLSKRGSSVNKSAL